MPPPRRKRAAAPSGGPASKKVRAPSGAPVAVPTPVVSAPQPAVAAESLRDRFLGMFDNPDYKSNGISNTILKQLFSPEEYEALPGQVINQLMQENRLRLSKGGNSGELFYQYVSEDLVEKLQGLDASAVMVYQVIEKADNKGIWTKDITFHTKIQRAALTKILKILEQRDLIKQVKSVAAKTKKLYMLYDLTPSTELTGGVWYSDLEFDHGFITEIRSFLLKHIKEMNAGRGVTAKELLAAIKEKKVSKVELTLKDVTQLLKTLEYDFFVDAIEGGEDKDQVLYVSARRVSCMCDFKWWDVLDPDFMYRKVQFDDGVELAPHEPHYQTK